MREDQELNLEKDGNLKNVGAESRDQSQDMSQNQMIWEGHMKGCILHINQFIKDQGPRQSMKRKLLQTKDQGLEVDSQSQSQRGNPF